MERGRPGVSLTGDMTIEIDGYKDFNYIEEICFTLGNQYFEFTGITMKIYEEMCPIEITLSIIGGKWKVLILWHLYDKVLRFGELKKLMPSITQKMLAQQLRELEADCLVNRKVYAVVPPKVEYSLTKEGKSLKPILHSMCLWGANMNRNTKGNRQSDPLCQLTLSRLYKAFTSQGYQ